MVIDCRCEHAPMQKDIRERLHLYWRKPSFEWIHYWDQEKHCIKESKTILYD